MNFFGYTRPLKEVYKSYEKERFFDKNVGIKSDDIPLGLVETPFKWKYLKKEYDMNFYSGFVGATNDGEYVKPVIGWAVGEKT